MYICKIRNESEKNTATTMEIRSRQGGRDYGLRERVNGNSTSVIDNK